MELFEVRLLPLNLFVLTLDFLLNFVDANDFLPQPCVLLDNLLLKVDELICCVLLLKLHKQVRIDTDHLVLLIAVSLVICGFTIVLYHGVFIVTLLVIPIFFTLLDFLVLQVMV